MKKTLLSILFLFTCGLIVAQKDYQKSENFPEFDGWTKLIMLRNNNTGLMEVSKDKDINFTLFNPERKKITTGKLPLKKLVDKLKNAQIEGVYDISGDYVAFIIGAGGEKGRQPIFYRIVVDGTTGKLKSEDVIDELPVLSMGDAYGMAFGDTDVPTFVIEKDPDSDNYAVIKYNSLAAETKDRIIVSHYGPDHKLINKASYNTPTDKYKYTKFLAAYVRGGEYVLISTCAFNTKKSGGEEIRYFVAQLSPGKTTFVQKELQYTEYTKDAECYFVINKPKDLITMVLLIKYTQINQNINPTSMALDKPYSTDWTKMNEMYKTQMENKNDFQGMIQGTFVDQKGNTTFVYQQMTKQTKSSSPGMPAQVVGVIYGDVAMITMSPEGKEVSSAVFPCNIYRSGDQDAFTYNNSAKGRKVSAGFAPVADNDWYKGMDFVSTDNASYLFFNNRLDNMEKPDAKEAGRISGISGTHGVKYTYKEGKIAKDFLFGKPASKKEAKFINPGSSTFDSASKTYATVLTDPETKTCNVVWTHVD